MAEHPTSRPRAPRGRRRRQRAAARHFSQEVAQLGATTISLPRPVRRGVIQWLRELLALLRPGRRAFSRRTQGARPPKRQPH